MKKVSDVDEYIAGFEPATREKLEQIRSTICEAAPDAQEIINYGIPTLTLNGNLVHFAAFNKHIGFYPAPSAIEKFSKELSVYKSAKGSVQFPFDKPLPLALVSRIVKFRVKENLAKKSPKTASKKMTKATGDKGPKEVSEFIQQLEPTLGRAVEAVRKIILSADKSVSEYIKWNNPAFYYNGELKAFDPKEYKRDIAVFNLAKGKLMLVLLSGATIKDNDDLLEGDYKDGRRIIHFNNLGDVQSKSKSLQKVIKGWLKNVGK